MFNLRIKTILGLVASMILFNSMLVFGVDPLLPMAPRSAQLIPDNVQLINVTETVYGEPGDEVDQNAAVRRTEHGSKFEAVPESSTYQDKIKTIQSVAKETPAQNNSNNNPKGPVDSKNSKNQTEHKKGSASSPNFSLAIVFGLTALAFSALYI